MSNFKAPDGSLHFLDDDSFAFLLPVGSVKITDKAAQKITEAVAAAQRKTDAEAAAAIEIVDPVDKLKAFLQDNLDVAAILEK